MTTSNCLHTIKITNLQDNLLIPYQLLLIKGVVDNFRCSKQQDIWINVNENELQATGLSQTTGKFKFLIDLGTENKDLQLNFTYCQAKLTLNIKYQRKESLYRIQPLLILAQDETVDNEKVRLNLRIIDLNLLLIQTVYGEKLNESANQRLTFAFNNKCCIFKSQLKQEDIWQLNEQDLWQRFAKELLTSSWGKQVQLKFIAFINCSKYLGKEVQKSQDFTYSNIRKHIKGHAALGAGGLALFSSTYFYAWPSKFENILNCFLNQQKLNPALEPDDSNYRKTKGGVYASSLGAVCHEIGHIFDLGHDLQGVMGSNFDYINRVFILQSKTENLPQRVVESYHDQANKPRFTQLKKPANGFLQRYREQQENDSFYFSNNSVIILAHHPWLRNDYEKFDTLQFRVVLDARNKVIKSLEIPLKLIEIRKCENSLIIEWFDLEKKPSVEKVYEFDLNTLKGKLNKDCYIFVMSLYGHCKKLELFKLD